MQKELKFAVLIDGDNAQPSLLSAVLKEIRSGNEDSNRPPGEIAIKRIYGDWTTNNMNGWKGELHNLGIRPIQQFRYDNNATDGALMMDAIEIIHLNSRINAFCIVSSDSDFYNLALRIRENGLYVVGIGTKQTKEVFRKACNDFVFTHNLSASISSTGSNAKIENQHSDNEKSIDKVAKFLIDTLQSISTSENEWVSLSRLGSSIKSEDPGFDPRTYGHRNLISLINYYQYFQCKSDESMPPNYSIKLNFEYYRAQEKLEGVVKKFIHYYGFIEHETGDYYFHVSNISEQSQNARLKRGAKVLFKVFKEPGADDDERGKASEIEIVDSVA